MIIEKLVIKTGTVCSLRCEKCGEFNPYFLSKEKSFLLSAETLCRDVFRILMRVARINTIHIAGGEPFLHKDLFLLVNFLTALPSVGTVEVVTNGTVVPDDITLAVLRNCGKKIVVLISDYSEAGVDNRSLIDSFQRQKVNHVVMKEMIWKDKSDISLKDYSSSDLNEIAKKCSSFRKSYFSLVDGIVTAHCPTAGSLLYYLDLHRDVTGFFFDLRSACDGEIETKLRELDDKTFTPMCQYCIPTYQASDCIAGRQLL